MTQYITIRRARFQALSGPVNIPWGTTVEAEDGVLVWGSQPLCAVTSQNAHDYFALDDDGHGLERGRLTAAVIGRLSRRDRDHQARWDKVWADRLCQRYRRADYEDYWLWDHDFYEAPLEDLRYIAGLVGVTKEERHDRT